MTPERWQQIDRLLNEVLEHPSSQRAEFLAEAAAGDQELQREVESLLGFHAQADDFIESPPSAVAADWLAKTESRANNTIGHYQLIRELGRGGMGVVYLANDTRLGRQVALKLLLEKLTKDATRVRRFRQEARAVSALNHPNIITVYEVGQVTPEPGSEAVGEHFIAAEFVEGQTLREKCRSGGMPLSQALDVMIQTCAALASAHEAGIIHRDIKPENIMLRPDGIVKVLDFGLAKLTEQAPPPVKDASFMRVTTQPGVVMGTTSYMSPEQARGLGVDARTDLFSLGVVMYELLTGQAPFKGETTADILVALLQGEPRRLLRYDSRLPSRLEKIVSRALSKTVEQRYQTAREIGNDLKQLKDELEFAAKLQGMKGQSDNVLNLMVGAGISVEDQTTFATRAVAAAHQKTTLPMPPVETSPKTFSKLLVNFSRPVNLAVTTVLLALATLLVWWKFAPTNKAIESVAVLPFADQVNDPQLEYLPAGIVEGLVDSLSQLTELTVRPTSTVMAYKGRDADPVQVGKALKVDAVVKGSVQREGQRFTVQIEVFRTEDGQQLWGERYEGELAGILAMQDEVSQELADNLRQRLSGQEQLRTVKRQTKNSEAYRLYTIARTLWLKRSTETTLKAIELFQQAINLDGNYAMAYVGMADAYSTLGSYRQMPPHDVYPKAREAAERALQLDAQLAEAHASMGKILTDYSWDWQKAEAEFRLAISQRPNYANAHHWYATLLSAEGRFDESLREVRLAQGLDFLSPATNTHVGNMLYRARRYDEAIVSLKETLALEPTFISARIYLSLCHLKQNRVNEALSEFLKTKQLAQESPDLVSLLGITYARMGQPEQARRYLAELSEMAKRRYVSAAAFASIHAALGDLDKAFEWTEKSFQEGAPAIRGLKTDPLYDSLRHDPRFDELLKRAGLTQ